MSAEKNEKGHWEIETSELFRVFLRAGSTECKEFGFTAGMLKGALAEGRKKQ